MQYVGTISASGRRWSKHTADTALSPADLIPRAVRLLTRETFLNSQETKQETPETLQLRYLGVIVLGPLLDEYHVRVNQFLSLSLIPQFEDFEVSFLAFWIYAHSYNFLSRLREFNRYPGSIRRSD